MTETQDTRGFKILSHDDWQIASALGYTKTALDEGDGYVHLSTREQVEETLRLHYAGQSDVRLLEYDYTQLDGDLRWEESRGGQLFPHLYGRLDITLASRIWLLQLGPDKTPQLPEDIDS